MWRRVTLAAIALMLGGAVVAAEETEAVAPEQVPGAVTVTVDEARRLHDGGAVFIDVRNPRLYARRHIPGAIHLDLYDNFNLANLERHVARDQPFVLYCSGEKCRRSSNAAEWAVQWGFTGVHYFRGGIVDWRDAGLPMVETE